MWPNLFRILILVPKLFHIVFNFAIDKKRIFLEIFVTHKIVLRNRATDNVKPTQENWNPTMALHTIMWDKTANQTFLATLLGTLGFQFLDLEYSISSRYCCFITFLASLCVPMWQNDIMRFIHTTTGKI